MTKIVSAVLLLREAKAPLWTADIDTAFTSWAQQYIQWLTTAEIALEERKAAK